MMMGLYFMKDVPFREIYIHALVRDEKGQKMSKSKGNIIDPVTLMDEYGTDALRFTLAAMAAQGRDIKLSEQRVAGYRNFVTKLWNASRFGEINGCYFNSGYVPDDCTLSVNRWIVGRTVETVNAVSTAIESYRFNNVADELYRFIWGMFCDWYIELIKPVLYGEEGLPKEETRQVFGWVLMQSLTILHPVAPFVTEALFRSLSNSQDDLLASNSWPNVTDFLVDEAAKEELDWVVKLVTEIRSVRVTMNVPASAKIALFYNTTSDTTIARLETHYDSISQLARLSKVERISGSGKGMVQIVLDESLLFLAVGDVINVSDEKERLQKEIAKWTVELEKINNKLSNENFIARAPSHVVEEQKERSGEIEASRQKLLEAVARLGAF